MNTSYDTGFVFLGILIWILTSCGIWYFLKKDFTEINYSFWSIMGMKYPKEGSFYRFLSVFQFVGICWLLAGLSLCISKILPSVTKFVGLVFALILIFGSFIVGIYILKSQVQK